MRENSSRHYYNSDDKAERLHRKHYKNYQIYVIHPTNEGMDKRIHYDSVPRIMEYEMIPDTLPHPTQSSITTFRTFFLVTISAVGYTFSAISPLFAAELSPYAPPSSQQRSVEQQSVTKPQLSTEDMERIYRIEAQAKQRSALKNTFPKREIC